MMRGAYLDLVEFLQCIEHGPCKIDASTCLSFAVTPDVRDSSKTQNPLPNFTYHQTFSFRGRLESDPG